MMEAGLQAAARLSRYEGAPAAQVVRQGGYCARLPTCLLWNLVTVLLRSSEEKQKVLLRSRVKAERMWCGKVVLRILVCLLAVVAAHWFVAFSAFAQHQSSYAAGDRR
jgi:hypothetical protein